MRLFLLTALTVLLLVAPWPVHAQPTHQGPDVAAQRAAMDRLAPMAGRWRGEARVTFPAETIVFQTERVERDLGGLVLVIHGTGYADAAHSGAPVFQAMAMISYNERSGEYEVRSYTHEGYATTARGEFLDDGRFRWSFSAGGPVQIRFTAEFNETSWREVGEISFDNGATWRETIDMALARVP